jgi:hypothetical protein
MHPDLDSQIPFRFEPLHFGWAAVPPKPNSLVIFIGGAFFGSFPTVFYRAVLQNLYVRGCAVVTLPFRFSFRHWDIALSIAEYQTELRSELTSLGAVLSSGLPLPTVWIGHSLGCKYIALIELLSDPERLMFSTAGEKCLRSPERQALNRRISAIDLKRISLIDQPSILIDPVISDLDSAVPLPVLRKLLSSRLRVWPSREETFCMINMSSLLQLTSILSFNSALAQSTKQALDSLSRQKWLEWLTIRGKRHLALLGLRNVDADVFSGVEKLLNLSLLRAGTPASATPPPQR